MALKQNKARKDKRCARFCKRSVAHFKDYCAKSSLHGVRYISDSSVSYKTSTFFAFAVIVGLLFFVYLIQIQLDRYESRPTVVTIGTTTYPIWRVPFPAVSICNYNKVHRNNTLKIAEYLSTNGIETELLNRFFASLSALITYNIVDTNGFDRIYNALDKAGYDSERLMFEFAQPCNKMLLRCSWKGQTMNCSEIFSLIQTIQGYCCVFNYVGYNTSMHGHLDHLDASGVTHGLQVVVAANEENYVSASEKFVGFYVIIQDGLEYPDTTGLAVGMGHEVSVDILPSVVISDDDVRTVNEKYRNCWFFDEGKLKWTKLYSFDTCITSCKAKAIYKACNCTPFYYARLQNERICTLMDNKCLKQKEEYYQLLVVEDYSGERIDYEDYDFENKEYMRCQCLPQCSENVYQVTPDKEDLKQTQDFQYGNVSIINVYSSSIICMQYTRSVIISWDTLLASIGGLFGLCIGGSIMSGMEVVFYVANGIVSMFETLKITKRGDVRSKQKTINVTQKLYPQHSNKIDSIVWPYSP